MRRRRDWSLEAGRWKLVAEMHELSVAQNIIDVVRQYVPESEAARVTAVRVRVGSLSGIVPESLAFCFSAIVAESAWCGARLDIESAPTLCQCRECRARFEPEALLFLCPSCGSGRVELVSGSDLQVVHVELSDGAGVRAAVTAS